MALAIIGAVAVGCGGGKGSANNNKNVPPYVLSDIKIEDIPSTPYIFSDIENIKGDILSIKDRVYETEEKEGKDIPGDLMIEHVWKYDQNGKLIEQSENYPQNHNGYIVIRYDYDEDKIINRTVKTNDGSKEMKINNTEKDIWEYVVKGYAGNTSYKAKIDGNTILLYDDAGTLIRKSALNKEGQPIKEEYLSEIKYETQNKYSKGQIVERKEGDLGNPNTVRTYKYLDADKKGNWTTRKDYYKEFCEFIVKREIEYK